MMRQVLQRCLAGSLVLRLPFVTSRALSGTVTGLRLARGSSSSDSTRRHDTIVFRGSGIDAQPHLSTRGFGDVASRSEGDTKPQAVLIQVGDGRPLPFEHTSLMKLNVGTLLEALAASRGFAVELRNVPLSKCVLTVCATASEDEPTAAEAAAACELKGTRTLGALAAGMVAATAAAGTNLFVRVTLPSGSKTTMADAAAVPGELRA